MTGHWGCGAFGGHREVKVLLQLIAAARANVQLVFFEVPPDDAVCTELTGNAVATFGQQLSDFSNGLKYHGISCGTLYRSLQDLRMEDFTLGRGVFNVLRQRLFVSK